MNFWLEVDEPRKRFFNAAYPLITRLAFLARNGLLSEVYEMYEAYMNAYKRLDVRLKLYDQNVNVVNSGIEFALNTFCPNDKRLNEIYTSKW